MPPLILKGGSGLIDASSDHGSADKVLAIDLEVAGSGPPKIWSQS